MLWIYLLLTILLELPIFLLFWHREGWLRATLFCILLNGFTNPLINLAIDTWGWNVYALEVGVVLTEMLAAMLILRGTWVRSLIFSVCANAWSYGIGLVLFALGWL